MVARLEQGAATRAMCETRRPDLNNALLGEHYREFRADIGLG
jgi:hypothetical protein